MRFLLKDFCRCCFAFESNGDDAINTIQKSEKKQEVEITQQVSFPSPFRLKETRERSVDYVLNSPRFGTNLKVSCTGGTEHENVDSED
jgi:hypothetical protein